MSRKITGAIAFSAVLVTHEVLRAAQEHAESDGGIAEEFMRTMKTSFWGVLAFVIVLLILWKKLFPPIVAALDRREQTIRKSLEAAERAKSEAQAMIAQHEESLEKARSEARAIIEEGKTDAEGVKNAILASAREEAKDISERAVRDIELAKKAAIDDLYRQAARLSFDIAEKVISKSLNPDDHQSLVDECIQRYHEHVE